MKAFSVNVSSTQPAEGGTLQRRTVNRHLICRLRRSGYNALGNGPVRTTLGTSLQKDLRARSTLRPHLALALAAEATPRARARSGGTTQLTSRLAQRRQKQEPIAPSAAADRPRARRTQRRQKQGPAAPSAAASRPRAASQRRQNRGTTVPSTAADRPSARHTQRRQNNKG